MTIDTEKTNWHPISLKQNCLQICLFCDLRTSSIDFNFVFCFFALFPMVLRKKKNNFFSSTFYCGSLLLTMFVCRGSFLFPEKKINKRRQRTKKKEPKNNNIECPKWVIAQTFSLNNNHSINVRSVCIHILTCSFSG